MLNLNRQLKKFMICSILIIIFSALFLVTAFAENTAESYISITEYHTLLEAQNSAVQPHIITCCDGAPHLVWIFQRKYHIYSEDDPAHICISHIYIGNQICDKCNSVWQYDTVYKQTDGCGRSVISETGEI